MYIMPTFEIWFTCTVFSTLYGRRTIKHRAVSPRRGPDGSFKMTVLRNISQPSKDGQEECHSKRTMANNKTSFFVFSCTESPLWLCASCWIKRGHWTGSCVVVILLPSWS